MDSSYALLFTTILMTTMEIHCLVAYDCQLGHVNMTTVSLVELPECDIVNRNITTDEVSIAVTQVTQFSEVRFIRCHIEEFHHVWRCGKSIDTGLEGGFYSTVPFISRRECEKMINEKSYSAWKNSDRIEIGLDSSGRHSFSFTSRGEITTDGSCTPGNTFSRYGRTYDRPVQNTRMEIRFSVGTARLSHDEDKLIFPSGVSCKYSDSACSHPDYGHLFWDKLIPECGSDKSDKSLIFAGKGKLITNFQGTTPVKYIQIAYDGYDFQVQLLDQTDYVCGYRSYLTEHPRLFVTILGDTSPMFPLTKKVQPLDVNLLNYVNSKIVYSMRHTKQEVERLFELFELDRCNTQNRITSTMLSLATRDPIEFAYLYFKKPGYTAVARGEVVHIAQCREVAVEPDMDHKGCFNELQVKHRNKTMFMSPKTRILIDFGTVVSCLPDLSPRFLIDGVWVSRTIHGLLKADKPLVMQHDNIHYSFSEIRGLSQGGLYSMETIQKYQSILTSPLVETVIASRISSAVKGNSMLPDGYTFSNGFSDSDYSAIQVNVGSFVDRILKKFSRLGEVTSTIIGIFVVIKTVIYILSCILNFKIMYNTFGLLTALCSFWWESLCNMMLHDKVGKKKVVETEELRELYTDGV